MHEYVPGFYDSPILSLLLGGCLVLWVFAQEKNLKSIQIKLFISFVVAAILSHLSWFYLQGTIDTADILLRRLAFFLIASTVFLVPKRIEFYIKVLSICGLILAVHGIDQYYSGGIGWTGMTLHGQDGRIRYIGIFSDPNDLGMLLLIVLVFLVYIAGSTKFVLLKFAWFLTIPVIFYAILLTKSRGTLAALLLLAGVYTWKRFNPLYTGVVAALIIPAALIKTRLSTIGTSEASTVGRVDAWYEGFQMLKSNPFLGVGYGLFTEHHHLVAHSSYVQVAAETGLIGYFFWFSFLFVSIYTMYIFAYKYHPKGELPSDLNNEYIKLNGLSKALLFALLAYAFSTFFISRADNPLLLILVAMSSGFYFYAKKKFPDYIELGIKKSFKLFAYSSIASLVFIYIIVFIFFRA